MLSNQQNIIKIFTVLIKRKKKEKKKKEKKKGIEPCYLWQIFGHR